MNYFNKPYISARIYYPKVLCNYKSYAIFESMFVKSEKLSKEIFSISFDSYLNEILFVSLEKISKRIF